MNDNEKKNTGLFKSSSDVKRTLNGTSYYFHYLERTQIEKLKLNTKPKTKPEVRLNPGLPIQFVSRPIMTLDAYT